MVMVNHSCFSSNYLDHSQQLCATGDWEKGKTASRSAVSKEQGYLSLNLASFHCYLPGSMGSCSAELATVNIGAA